MKKYFFFDIDGTLIDCDNDVYSIPLETRNAMDELKNNGHKVFLATGRCKCFILDGVIDYPFSGLVTCNGACVEYDGSIVYKKVIPTVAIKKTYDLCKKMNLAFYFEANDKIYVLNKNNPRHIEFKDKWGMKDEIIVDNYNIDDLETYIGMIVLNNEDEIEIMKKELSPYFNIQRHQMGLSFDLTLLDESKAKGIEELMKYLNKDMNDTIAFGDGRNDIEMISSVGLGIAMGNAAKETKENAKYVTETVGNNGILKALKHFSFIS